MALTPEDLQAIGALLEAERENTRKMIQDEREATRKIVQEELAAVKSDISVMQADIVQIKEDTAVTRNTVNGLGEWTEVASDVLKIRYPLKKAE